MSQTKHWKSFGEQQQTEEFKQLNNDEFAEELPFESFDSKGLLDAKAPRRDFLKYVGFSTAAAALAASCKQPIKQAIPYAIKPENMTPGIADYYATTYINGGEAIPVIAKVRDGRPIKIEGNDLCSFTNGGTSARVQASVLDLYDMSRLRQPLEKHNNGFAQVPSFDILDKKIGEEIAKTGKSVVLLTSTVSSESSKKIIGDFLAKMPTGSKAVQYDTVSYSGMLDANLASYGKRAIPSFDFSVAKTIVSLGADFLGTWVAPIEHAAQYAQGRKVNDSTKVMSKHYQFESFLSMTGANADERFRHKPSQTGAIASALLSAVGGGVVELADAGLKAAITKVGAELKANSGKALVVCGSNDINVQIIVNAINQAIGANGSTIDWARTNNSYAGSDADMKTLVDDMAAGKIGTLLINGVNPVYSYFDADAFKKAMAQVPVTVSFNEKKDETSVLCKYIIPDHHFLESWGDAEPKFGYTSFIQPTIHPLFKTRNYQTSLLKWSGVNQDYAEYVKAYWVAKLGGQTAFDNTLQTGIIENKVAVGAAAYNAGKLEEAKAKVAAYKTSEYELALYQKVGMGDGKNANNPWLQEMPDPITKATWDNYIVVGAKTADKLNINYTSSDYEYRPPKPVFKVTVGGKSVELPVIVVPGCAEGVIAIAVGYGRSENVGIAASGAGKNVFNFTSFDGATIQYNIADAKIEKVSGKSHKIAQNQNHGYYEDRMEVVKERTLADAIAHPTHIIDDRAKEMAVFFAGEDLTAAEKSDPFLLFDKFRKKATIYPNHAAERAIHWGMNVDLNSCIGCGACVVACNAENNVSVVGKSEVTRGHDMHWIRIDRYYSSTQDSKDPDNVDVTFTPTMCQHCDNAPCENVCPVAATNHSTEGLNQMTYNRCIGTRYCANNCPYKVRRFNWADYTGADSFPNNQDAGSGLNKVVVEQMNDDLTRMVLNPDVTVRSRGVIEKCSFCVQRLQEGKLNAKKEGRALEDKDIKVACAQSCPTHAITFGNIKGKDTEINKVRNEQKQRLYYVLEPLHTLSNVSYLAKIRNKGAGLTIAGLAKEEHVMHSGAGHNNAAHGAEHKEQKTEHKAEH